MAAPAHAGQSKTYNGNGNSSGKAANGHDAAPRLHALGWIEYVLPDAAIYYVHPTLRVTTDINLRNLKQLEIVTSYLERNGEGFKVPQGYELWLRDAAEGKRRECVPVRNWVDHIQRHISFEGPEERHAHHHLHEDDSELTLSRPSTFSFTAVCLSQNLTRSIATGHSWKHTRRMLVCHWLLMPKQPMH